MLTGVNTWFREGGRLSREMVGEIYQDMARKAVTVQARQTAAQDVWQDGKTTGTTQGR
jgi:hypothetical protein